MHFFLCFFMLKDGRASIIDVDTIIFSSRTESEYEIKKKLQFCNKRLIRLPLFFLYFFGNMSKQI
mgnify:CR=1 FL=1